MGPVMFLYVYVLLAEAFIQSHIQYKMIQGYQFGDSAIPLLRNAESSMPREKCLKEKEILDEK